ncbi:MAG: polyprenyl synthetase family protein [bacterium]|nr:polyprenyl synthetase family protein [bacterium]
MTLDVDSSIRSALDEQAEKFIQHRTLRKAAKHLLGKGKLYRPKLALATFEAFTGVSAVPWVAVVTPLELVHTFTLIHDDLPCMDDAELRRGVKAVHIQCGEALAVLAGDALCNVAFQVLHADRRLGDGSVMKLCSALADGIQAVVAGQVADLEAEGLKLSISQLEELQRLKTGALLGASCEFGAILSAAKLTERRAVREIGEKLGLLFQLRDDLLSVESTEQEAGKSLHTDTARGKSTFHSLLGIEGAKKRAAQLWGEVELQVKRLGLVAPESLLRAARQAFEREA